MSKVFSPFASDSTGYGHSYKTNTQPNKKTTYNVPYEKAYCKAKYQKTYEK